jgi:16S rRNA (guanine(966)-N(2))-methyltransferase RsmD
MRIISGTFKGRRILPPKNLPVRPTTDMAKEALFNIINNRYYFDELSVLDLFTGTGNISFEFASRGVISITSVDKDYGCIRFVKKTAEEFTMPIHTMKMDVFKYLEQTNQTFDLIFADPPYQFSTDDFLKIPNIVFNNNLLNEDGVLIIEHSIHTNLSEHNNFDESRHYGGSSFSFFKL